MQNQFTFLYPPKATVDTHKKLNLQISKVAFISGDGSIDKGFIMFYARCQRNWSKDG